MDAALALFYTPALTGSDGGGGGGRTFSRSAEKRTLMTHYALVLALHVDSFAMAAEQARRQGRLRTHGLGQGARDDLSLNSRACGSHNKRQGQGGECLRVC